MVKFALQQPIFMQIAARMCDSIVTGQFDEGARLPSVREYAALMQVNPNTVMRTYEHLAAENIIFNRRGIGFFVADGAVETIRSQRRLIMEKHKLNEFFAQLKMLDINPEQLYEMYKEYLQK